MKDPAIIFYTSDFMIGVSNLTMEERGQYITLLCLQHQLGHLSKKTIDLNISNISQDVLDKFKLDENKLYYNERLEYEIEKRSKFIEHQIENGKKGGRPKNPNKTQSETQIKPKQKPLENENDNENINDNDNRNIINIINYLNNILNSKYRANNKVTMKHINARLKEGYTFDDFKTVIDKKYAEWNNTEMQQYLNPETLFGTKFEKYLNQPVKKRTLKDISLDELEVIQNGYNGVY